MIKPEKKTGLSTGEQVFLHCYMSVPEYRLSCAQMNDPVIPFSMLKAQSIKLKAFIYIVSFAR